MPRTRVSQTTARAGGEPILSPTLDIGNQISLGAMSSQATHSPTSSMSTKSAPRVPAFFTGSAFPLLAVLVLVCGTAGLAFATSGTGAPVILTLLALLAALGIFFLFGLIAGHVRVAERTTQTDVITQAFARVENGLIVTGPDGAVWQANTAAYDLLGLNEHADLRLLEHAFGHDADANAAMFRLSRAVERGLTRSEDVHLPEPGYLRPGRWVRISATPFTTGGLDTDASGATIWSLVDMTIDRARAEKTREKLERRVGLLETMPGGLIAIDGDDRLRHVSPQVSRWLQAGGLERDATEAGETIAAGERAAEMISGDGIDRIRAAAERARMAGDQREAVQPVDIDLIDNDGILRPATAFVGGANHDGVASTADADGRGGFLALIVPRQQTHDDAANVTDDPALRDVVRAAPFGLATLSADGIIISANTAFARLSQLSGGLAGRSAAALLSQGVQPDDAAKIKQALEQALAGKANIEPIDTTVGEDAARARRIFFASHTGGGDDAPRASIYVLDATEQRALERQFAQSQKMEVVGKLAGGIAHDFNNDLTAIIGFSDLLLSTHRPGDPAYPNIREINASANHAASLVSNLLAFSRQQQLQPEIIDVHDLITDQTVFLRQPLGSNIDFKVRPARDLWRIKADASELRRAIVNLVRNAADAMPDGGTLTLRTHNITERASARMADLGVPTGEYVAIEVADTGIGMAPEVMEKIFEPFFTTKDVGKGTGFGLSTVYGIVKQTNGFIFPESTPGKGTTFRVYLPRHVDADADATNTETAAAAASNASDTKQTHRDLTGVGRVLVVEDEDGVRAFATQALRRQGYEVVQASDGYEALELFEEEGLTVDLVVSDVKMPEMDGPTLLKHVRKKHPDLKFVFVSGYPADAFSKTLSDEDNYSFLPKPYSLAQIAERVKEQIAT